MNATVSRTAAWLRSRQARRGLLMTGVIAGCFLWAMVVFGLSMAMVDRGIRQWWLMPVFGALVLLVASAALFGISRRPQDVSAAAPTAVEDEPTVTTGRPLPIEPLSQREMEVLAQLAAGLSNREIARALHLAPGTVKAHLNHIFGKLDAASRLQAVAHARQAGLLNALEQK